MDTRRRYILRRRWHDVDLCEWLFNEIFQLQFLWSHCERQKRPSFWSSPCQSKYQRIPLRCAHLEKGISRRSEEHTSELQSLMRISYAVFCLKKKKIRNH